MSDIKELINKILSDPKLAGSDSFKAKVYTDEPIIKTASQMANYLPPEYREMRKIARSHDSYRKSEQWIFYHQAKLMEDFEDDFDYHGKFFSYYPTYMSMNDLQLRGYFSWRTKVRHGEICETSLSYAFVYIYELINLIGVSTAEDGFEKLRAFWSAYRLFDNSLDRYMKQWLTDYIVYYGLDRSLLNEFSDTEFERKMLVLYYSEQYSANDVFLAVNTLSTYNAEKSKFYKEYSEDFEAVACAVILRLQEHYEKNCRISFFEKLFGRIFSGPYYMFGSAVFYDRLKYQNYEYIINDLCSFTCINGRWSCKRCFGSKTKSRELGMILKAVDRIMREKYAYQSLLKPEKTTKLLAGIIDKEIEKYLDIKKKNSTPEITIDVSKLQGIRRASIETRDKLIVDELEDEPEEKSEQVQNDTELNETEFKFMQLFLYGKQYAEFVKNNGIMLSVLVDSINEKFFDMFGDTVIVFDGDKPELIEDYTDELKGIIRI